MAYTQTFGGSSTNRSSYAYGVGHRVYSTFGGYPTGNIDSGGTRRVKVYGVSVIGLSGGTASITSGGGNFTIWCTSNSSTMYFGRLNDNGVNTIDEQDGTAYSPRGSLCGSFTWATVPAQPTMVSATPGSSGAITVKFSGNSNGGASISSWQLQYDDNSGFTSPSTITSSGTSTITGTPGVKYYFRARGNNDVGSGAWSGSINATAVGAPSATRNLTAGVSTTEPNTINLDWDAPTTPGGTITGYKIYRNGTLVHTTSGTGTSYTMGGLTRNTSYSFVVRARNAYSDSIDSEGAASNTASQTAQGVPSAPQSLTAVADALTPGEIDLDWSAPSYSGVGGITGYSVYYSTGGLITSSIPAGTTAYTVTGLTPGVNYGFVVRAKNAISTASGDLGDASATVYESALGDPPAVTGLAVAADPKVAGRLILTWTDPDIGVAAVVGYTVFSSPSNVELGRVTAQKFVVDGLTPGTTYSFYVKARNTVTEDAGSSGGPSSTVKSGVPGATANQPTGGGVTNSVTNQTNTSLAGSKVITSMTGTTFSYAYAGSPVTSVASGGTALDTTNDTLNGTYTITVTTPNAFTYAKTAPNMSTTNVTKGDALNNTNNAYNGTFTVTAADSFVKTVSYALVGPDLATTATTGTLTNNSNAIFNGSGFVITAITSNTFSYSQTAANVVEISATGTATDTTNRDVYNGTYEVADVPSYDSFTYERF